MAGVKRRTKYRKHVEADVFDSLPEPEDGQLIVRMVNSRGANLIEVEAPNGDRGVCRLPTKWRKMVWVRRGQFLIVTQADGDYERTTSSKKASEAAAEGASTGAVTFQADHVLHDNQVKHLVKSGKWPAEFTKTSADDAEDDGKADSSTAAAGAGGGAGAGAGGDDEDSDDSDASMAGVFVNKNRRRGQHRMPSDSEESDSEDSA